MEKVELQSDDQVAADLQDTLILDGNSLPSVSDNERCDKVATEVIRTKLSISPPNSVFVAAYRIRKKDNEQAYDNREILVKFTNKQQKSYLISAAKPAKPEVLFVSENLTPLRQKIPYALRQAKKNFPSIISGTYTQKWNYLCVGQAHRPVHWRFKYSSQNCDSGDAEKILQQYIRYTLRPGSECFFLISSHAYEPGTMLMVLLPDFNVYVHHFNAMMLICLSLALYFICPHVYHEFARISICWFASTYNIYPNVYGTMSNFIYKCICLHNCLSPICFFLR